MNCARDWTSEDCSPHAFETFTSCCRRATHCNTVAMHWWLIGRVGPDKHKVAHHLLARGVALALRQATAVGAPVALSGAAQLAPSRVDQTVARMSAPERPPLFVRIYSSAKNASCAAQSLRLVVADTFSMLQARRWNAEHAHG